MSQFGALAEPHFAFVDKHNPFLSIPNIFLFFEASVQPKLNTAGRLKENNKKKVLFSEVD